MRFDVTYSLALSRHPEQVNEIISKLRKGKSKFKNASPIELKWYYEVYVACNKANPLSDEVSINKVMVFLHASKKQWWSNSAKMIVPIPEEIIESRRKDEEERTIERNRINSLTPEQRNAETQEILNELRGTKGFFEINI